MILLQKAYCEKIMQMKDVCHRNTQEFVCLLFFVFLFVFLPKKSFGNERALCFTKAEDLQYFT